MIFVFFFKQELRFRILLRDLITVIFCYQISLKSLKTLSLSQMSFPSDFPLCYSFPYEFTNSDKGKIKTATNPVAVFLFS